MKSRRRAEIGDGSQLRSLQVATESCPRTVNWWLRDLAVARFDRDFNSIEQGPLDGAQDASVRFVSDQPKQLSLLVVLLDEGQSAISDGAGVAHVDTSRNVSCWRSYRSCRSMKS